MKRKCVLSNMGPLRNIRKHKQEQDAIIKQVENSQFAQGFSSMSMSPSPKHVRVARFLEPGPSMGKVLFLPSESPSPANVSPPQVPEEATVGDVLMHDDAVPLVVNDKGKGKRVDPLEKGKGKERAIEEDDVEMSDGHVQPKVGFTDNSNSDHIENSSDSSQLSSNLSAGSSDL